MKRSAWRLGAGALLSLLGLLVLLNSVISGAFTEGSGGIGLWAAGLIPILLGLGLAATAMRGSGRRETGEEGVDRLKQEIRWRALASGGRVTASEVAAMAGHAAAEVERALMALVAEGIATAEAGGEGEIVYRIAGPAGGREHA